MPTQLADLTAGRDTQAIASVLAWLGKHCGEPEVEGLLDLDLDRFVRAHQC